MGEVILSWAAFAIGTLMLFEAVAYLGFGTGVGLLGILGAAAVGAVLTFVFRDNIRASDVQAGFDVGGVSDAQAGFDVGEVILSWAAFAIGTLMLFEAVAYLGFGTGVGLLGILGTAAVGAVLTFVFRDNIRLATLRLKQTIKN